uniref:Myb-like DNA-binding domain-containing protein n=1 Tax=Trepomonas sp. PC1 TaxID=1076344 RepID=A0A146KE24_9EUKA|eukprot:JAP95080.1 Myb-like DNA-binding domain-containing protein [Trepomonas sp. PC1]
MKWTNEEKERLIESVKAHTVGNRIQWSLVQNEVGKSANQCKSMYIIQLNLKQFSSNQKWSYDQTLQLFALVYNYGTQWQFLQKNYFPSRTAGQLKQKYLHAGKQTKAQMQLVRQLMENDVVDCKAEMEQILENLVVQQKTRNKVDEQIKQIEQGQSALIPDLDVAQFLIKQRKVEEQKCEYRYTLDDCVEKIKRLLGQ